MNNPSDSAQPSQIRRLAAELALEKTSRLLKNLENLSPAEIQAMFHELQVHQIELEMQNEELRQTQAELDTSRARYFDLYDQAPVGYCTIGASGLILEANFTAVKLLGIPRSSLVQQRFSRFILREDQDIYFYFRKQLFEALQPQTCELRMVKQDDQLFWARLEAIATQGEGGILLSRVILSDITQRRQIEEDSEKSTERLHRSEIELKKAQAIAHVGSWIWDIQHGLIEWSDEMYRIFGIDPHSVTGRLGDAIARVIHPEDLQIFQASNAQAFAERKPVEYRIIHPDGSIHSIWAETGDVILDEAGSPIFLTGTAQDITPHKRAEEALRKFATVFQFSPDAIAIVRAADGILIDANPVVTTLLELSHADLIGRSWRGLNIFSDIHDCDQMVAQFREKGRVADYELDVNIRPGFQVTVLISLIPIQVDGAECVLAITHDITERKRSEETLRRIQAELALGIRERSALQERQRLARELHDSVSQVLYGISLGAHTALTLMNSNPIKTVEALEYVISLTQAGLAEMRALIFELRPESLELEGLVKALLKQSAALQARHGIEVQSSLGDEPVASIAIKEAVYRITQEAMQNAVKHARAHHLNLRLETKPGSLEVEVRDDGIGFDPTAMYPGHLGLRSMRERAANLGGTLEITSAVNRGTCVRASIPLPPAEPC